MARNAQRLPIESDRRQLAVNDEAAVALRAKRAQHLAGGEAPRAGNVLTALRRSLLVGTGLDLARDETPERDAGL